EDRYISDDLSHFRFVIKEENFGHRSRKSARLARNRIRYILHAAQDKILLIDWTGISITSSGFADELVSKLQIDLGDQFDQRIRLTNMSSEVKSIVSSVIHGRSGP
ncbi:MAG: STAS-like domain-containing protein, partial [Phycisphaerales bacterium JB065]